MSYITGERLAESLIKGAAGFGTPNVTRGDWKILNSGNSDHYAILKRGEVSVEWQTMRISTTNYRTIIEVWQRVKDDQASYDALLTYVDDIQTRIEQYRKLADTAETVFDANLTGTGIVTEQWRNSSDGPSWLKIDLYLDWSNQENVTFAE
jgi:hypothetical protein